MKKITYLFLFLITSLGYSQTIFDFEGTAPVFNDFNGSNTQVIANPDPTGTNTSANVAQNIVPAGAAFAGVNVAAAIDITDDRGFTLQVWSAVQDMPVLLKLENSATGVNVERVVALTTVNEWEEITFDFSAEGALTFDSVTLFMNFNVVGGEDQTYYWDNLEQYNIPLGDPVFFPVTFENQAANYNISGFEGAISTVEPNPDASGNNTSATVVRTEKSVGAQFFAGTLLPLDTPINFSTVEQVAIKTWSPKANIPVRLKLENLDGSEFLELDVMTTTTNEWEELVWDFTGQTAGIDFVKVIVFFEFIENLPGDGSVYYFDDVRTTNQLGVDAFSSSRFTVYPNPVQDILTIDSEKIISEITIYNTMGQKVLQDSPSSLSTSIQFEALASGVYIAELRFSEGTQTVRIIKE